jgi:DMSO/TMAO reductase YedYZ molybdopterin-dependent catalytic subunit
MDPVGPYRRHPLAAHQLTEDVTPVRDCVVLAHLGIPRIQAEDWSLQIGGLVRRPFSLTLPQLRELPRTEVVSVHECAGSPLEPTVPQRRVVNVRWGGVPLTAVLEQAGVDPAAEFLWSFGADGGAFADVHTEAYAKDLPLWRLGEGEVLLAYEINGQALPAEHGFPVRLVVPGWYGTNSVKWLTRLELAERRYDGPFTTRFYNDPVPGRPGETRPVWRIGPECVIVAPAPDAEITGDVEVWGRAWGDAEITGVDVSSDGGETWRPARVEARIHREWQRFTLRCSPARAGTATLLARATDSRGATQPMTGARNAVHSVEVTVRGHPSVIE